MEYTVIDFETANSNRSSVCSLGLVKVKEGKIIEEQSYLINPEEEFDSFNIYINGITPEMVTDKPNFKDCWPKIKNELENGFIIAHNASFDISVLRHVLDKYKMEYPHFQYSCTRILSKKTWANLTNYRLDTIASKLGIKFKHHIATEDAKATAIILNEIFKINSSNSFEDLHEKLKVKIGTIYAGGYKPACVKSNSRGSGININDIKPQVDEFDYNNEFYEKCIAFTGTLESMPRKEAMQKVINAGGKCSNTITKKTNYLVMGIQDYSKFTDGQKSNKLKKAEELISGGQELEIITEEDFVKYI